MTPTVEFWILLGTGLVLYGGLIAAALTFGPRWFHQQFSEREKFLASLITKSEKTFTELQAELVVYKAQLAAKDAENGKLRLESGRCGERINELTKKVQQMEQTIADLTRELEKYTMGEKKSLSPLLVAIGSDAALKIDLAALRVVRTRSGMGFTRIEDASVANIKRHLDRARINNRPYDKLHLAIHAGPNGLVLGGAPVNAVEFSEILEGINVMLIAGCEGDVVGDFLGIVPYVVTMTDKVEHSDAALFTIAFWEEIGHGHDPAEALEAALDRAPSGMSETVERHF